MNDAAQRELIGRTLGGRFRLTAFLCEGAMASVFRGEQDAEPRDVAVKIMHAELLQEPTFAKRFTREAKAAARIEHENSVRILEQGADGELLYLAMELLSGQDLFDLLARERRLPEARAARIAIQICGALAAAHAQGIVHRDLKPENVMILPDPARPGADLVKVLDFGIAKILERGAREASDDDEPMSRPAESAPPSSVLTRVGTLVGTPEYMSPEQSMGQAVDARSDIYSCGVLLFHIVTGKAPFTGRAPIEVMMQQVDKPPPAPSSLAPGLHAGLEQVILKALSKAREARHQSADELAGELRAILPELGSNITPPSSGPKPLASSAPRPPASDPSAGLRGVPSSVKIQAPAVRGSDPPPETLRSPAPSPPVPEVKEKVAVAAQPAAAAVAKKAVPAAAAQPVTIPKPAAEPAPAPVPRAEEAVAVVAATPPQPPVVKRAPAATPQVLARAPQDGWIAPWWVFAIGVVVLSALIWLARYLRFG
jgi:eukaryotic-like serine/threonine-protein kinase